MFVCTLYEYICMVDIICAMQKIKKHRKNCETALFKVRIVENVFCRKEGK